jgi:hypothetical protein
MDTGLPLAWGPVELSTVSRWLDPAHSTHTAQAQSGSHDDHALHSMCAGAAGKLCSFQRGYLFFCEMAEACAAGGGIGVLAVDVRGPWCQPPVRVLGSDCPVLDLPVYILPDSAASLVKNGNDYGDIDLSITAVIEPLGLSPPCAYAPFDGTSMATPHVSAVAAYALGTNPRCKVQQLRDVLYNTALDIARPGKDNDTGYGMVQARGAERLISALNCTSTCAAPTTRPPAGECWRCCSGKCQPAFAGRWAGTCK